MKYYTFSLRAGCKPVDGLNGSGLIAINRRNAWKIFFKNHPWAKKSELKKNFKLKFLHKC